MASLKQKFEKISTLLEPVKWIYKAVLFVVIVASIAVAAYQLIVEYDVAGSLMTTTFLVATLIAIVYRVVNPYGWTLTLEGLGFRTGIVESTRVWLLAESRRWLPGGVWGYASRAVQAEQLGVTKTAASASMLVELLLTMLAAVIVALLGLIFEFKALSNGLISVLEDNGAFENRLLFAGALAVSLAAASLAYMFRKTFMRKLKTLNERFKLLRSIEFNSSRLGLALFYFVIMACLNGCVNMALLSAVSDTAAVPWIAMVAATATAWIIGFLAFFSPGGILVREAALTALLLPWMPYEAGITLAVLSRLAQLIAEVVCMLLVIQSPKKQTAHG
ncbi:MAG: lysylphosphatidylglycerol synthase domain-containing protein [Planctomycetota bacterium]